jgi:hypothetical protein
MYRNIIAIAVDPGLTGAAVALCDTPRRLAHRSAHGTGGYYSGIQSGALPFQTAAAVLEGLLEDMGPLVATSEVWAVIEEPGKWAAKQEGAARLAKVVADVTTWKNAASAIAGRRVLVWDAQRVDRRAGLRRCTRGRAGRKAEVRRFNLQNVERGTLPPFREIPPGCTVPSDGLHDAVHMARALLRVAKGGAL